MLAEHLARHVLGDLLVVLKLARVACEEGSSNIADAGLAPVGKKLPDHHRLSTECDIRIRSRMKSRRCLKEDANVTFPGYGRGY